MTPLVVSALAANTGPMLLSGMAADQVKLAATAAGTTLEMSCGCPPAEDTMKIGEHCRSQLSIVTVVVGNAKSGAHSSADTVGISGAMQSAGDVGNVSWCELNGRRQEGTKPRHVISSKGDMWKSATMDSVVVRQREAKIAEQHDVC